MIRLATILSRMFARRPQLIIACCLVCLSTTTAAAQIETLVAESCISCHDESTDTGLNLDQLNSISTIEKTSRLGSESTTESAQARCRRRAKFAPKAATQKKSLAQIENALKTHSKKSQRENGRASIRRLTRTEYEYSLHDLLGIHTELARLLPEENESGYDTVAENQGVSLVHAKSWLSAAEAAIDSAINLGAKPDDEAEVFEMLKLDSVQKHFSQKSSETVVLDRDKDGIIIYDSSSTWLYSLHKSGVEHSGEYRIEARAETVRSETPIVLAFFAGNYSRGQSRILNYFDVVPGEKLSVDFETMLRRGEYIFPQAFELTQPEDGSNVWAVGAKDYQGSGLKLKWVSLTGPLHNSWPPVSATNLLPGVEFKKLKHTRWVNNKHIHYEIVPPTKDPLGTIRKGIVKLASRAFRRPLQPGEVDEHLKLAQAALDDGASFEDASRLAARSVLCSPNFLFLSGDPGELDDLSLASRLSYFLWKSIPDSELLKTAHQKTLGDSKTLAKQTDRMLDDPRSQRFVADFLGQWLELRRIDATVPDSSLYPEYDLILRDAMLQETESLLRRTDSQRS